MTPEHEYRVYEIGEDGHIAGRAEISCVDDEEAKARAMQLANGRIVELWQGVRKIVLLEHRPEHTGSITHEIHDGRMIPKLAK